MEFCSGLHADVERINEDMKISTPTSFQNVAEVLQTGEIFTEKKQLLTLSLPVVEELYGNDRYDYQSSGVKRKREKLTQILGTIKSQSLDQLSVKDELALPMEAYNRYKTSYVENVQFDSYVDSLGRAHLCKYND